MLRSASDYSLIELGQIENFPKRQPIFIWRKRNTEQQKKREEERSTK
jgi:hypothetical protein